jgi:hypothetical protein
MSQYILLEGNGSCVLSLLFFFCGIKEPKDSVMDPIPLFILNCEASPIWFSINFQILGWT